jgi:hypothetical protein
MRLIENGRAVLLTAGMAAPDRVRAAFFYFLGWANEHS